MCPEAYHPRWIEVVRAGYIGNEALARAALGDPDARVRTLALSALVRQGAATGPDLAGGLSDPEPSVRRRAAELLARAELPIESRPDLLPLLPDVDDRVTEVAAFAAGELIPPATGVIVALCGLATSHRDALCRESAVAALGSLGDPAGLEAVLAACDDRATVRRRAVLALAAFDSPGVESMLRRLCDDRDLQVRQAAEDLLGISDGT